MSTADILAVRALRKLKVIGATETAAAEDLELAIQALRDAHAVWAGLGLLRWTFDTIPNDADLAYTLFGAYLAAPDFNQPQDATWSAQALGMVQTLAYLPTSGDICSEEL